MKAAQEAARWKVVEDARRVAEEAEEDAAQDTAGEVGTAHSDRSPPAPEKQTHQRHRESEVNEGHEHHERRPGGPIHRDGLHSWKFDSQEPVDGHDPNEHRIHKEPEQGTWNDRSELRLMGAELHDPSLQQSP